MTSGAPKTEVDLGRLWQRAFIDYNETVGEKRFKIDISGLGLISNLDEVIAAVNGSSSAFKKYRHSNPTLDKVRTFIGANLSYVQAIGDKVISSATTAFPPAGAIWTVATYAITVCQDMSRDYNDLLALIGEAGNFLKTLQIIEERIPDCDRYVECVTEALTALVMVFAIQTRYMLQKRAMTFLHTLGRGGSDPELRGAYEKVTAAIDRLTRANGLMAVKNTEDIKILMRKWGEKVDFYHEDIVSRLEEQQDAIQENQQAIEANQQWIEANQQGIEANQVLLKQIIRLQLLSHGEGDYPAQDQPNAKDGNVRTSAAFSATRAYFDVKVDPIAMMKDLERSFVPGTDSWLSEVEEFKSWANGNETFLWLKGDEGTGKSYLALSIIKTLQAKHRSQPHVAVAYFFFQEQSEASRSCKNALSAIGLQICTQDRNFREKVASGFNGNTCADMTFSAIWKNTRFSEHYAKDSDNALFLILDAFDEAEPAQRKEFLSMLQTLKRTNPRIKVLFTSRVAVGIDALNGVKIEITNEKSRAALVTIIESRMEALPRLSRLRSGVKEEITHVLSNGDHNILFVDRFIQTLEGKALERPVLRELRTIPKNLVTLYDQILSRVYDKRPEIELAALRIVFSWLAFCSRPLTLLELNSVMLVKLGSRALDFEDEVMGKCSSILGIASSLSEEEEHQKRKEKLLQAQLISVEAKQLDERNATTGEISHQNPALDTSRADLTNKIDDVEDDSMLVLNFLDRSLKKYARGTSSSTAGFRQYAFSIHLDIFVTAVDALCNPTQGIEQNYLTGLCDYAAFSWIKHLFRLDFYDGVTESSATDEQIARVTEALYRVNQNAEIAAKRIYEHSIACYDDLAIGGQKIIRNWANRALQSKRLSDNSAQWARDIVLDPSSFLFPLAKGHVKHWLCHPWPTHSVFMAALKVFKLKNGQFGDRYDAKDVEELCSIFTDIPKGARAYRNIGLAFIEIGEHKAAADALRTSRALCETETERFFTLVLMAQAEWAIYLTNPESGRAAQISEYLNDALKLPPPESEKGRELVQQCLMLRGDLELSRGELADGLRSYEEATAVSPAQAKKCFEVILIALDSLHDYQRILETVIRLGSVRLTMSKRRERFLNKAFQMAAKKMGKTEMMVRTYQRIIKDLEPLKWASPARYQLALAFRRVIGDAPKAKDMLYEVLDCESCIHPADGRESQQTFSSARRELAEIVFEQFRQASSLKEKQVLLYEFKAIQGRLGQDYSQYELLLQTQNLARMYAKLEPVEFYQILQKQFQKYIEFLQDDNPWNDGIILRLLSKLLSYLPGLENEASIALSAQFYVLDSKVMRNFHKNTINTAGEAENKDDSDEDGLGAFELKERSTLRCDGNCRSRFSNVGKPLHMCAICENTILCESCLKKVGTDEQLEYGFCGIDHQYVKAPVEGWEGIKNGTIFIKNEEPILFSHWLKELRDVKWIKAWNEFWRGC